MRFIVALAGLALVSCNASEPVPEDTPAPTASETAAGTDDGEGEIVTSDARPIPALDGEGLRMVIPSGATRLLAFGMPRKTVEDAIVRSLGKAGTQGTLEECGAGPIEFSRVDGLTLNFQDGAFIGWMLQPPSPLTTLDGIGIGTTRSQAEASRRISMIPDSTLGAEFDAGGIGGFFDGEGGTVSLLYAGTQCFFR